jgi:hypothetical protein
MIKGFLHAFGTVPLTLQLNDFDPRNAWRYKIPSKIS